MAEAAASTGLTDWVGLACQLRPGGIFGLWSNDRPGRNLEEHLDPDRLSTLERSVFGGMRRATVIISTPNREYNELLGVPPHRLRHADHRFEWDRARFRCWAGGVAARNGYDVDCHDIAGHHPTVGGASQMAVFELNVPDAVRLPADEQKRHRQDYF